MDIVHPEMMTLRVGIGQLRPTDLLDLLQHALVLEHCVAQPHPILPATTANNVVNGSKAETLMVEVAVAHHGRYRDLRRWQRWWRIRGLNTTYDYRRCRSAAGDAIADVGSPLASRLFGNFDNRDASGAPTKGLGPWISAAHPPFIAAYGGCAVLIPPTTGMTPRSGWFAGTRCASFALWILGMTAA